MTCSPGSHPPRLRARAKTRPVSLAASLLALPLLLLGACQTAQKPTGAATSEGFPAPNQGIVYDFALQALDQQGFIPDLDRSDPTAGRIETRYKTSLQPFSRKGFREKATVTIRPVSGRPGYFTTDAQIVRDYNDNLDQPSSIGAAEWTRTERVEDEEQLLNERIQMNFLPGGLSPAFRRIHGMEDSGADEPPPRPAPTR